MGATLTRRGWAVLGAAVTLVAAGRLLGIPELFAIAVVAVALSIGALGYVRYARWELDATREIRPPQVHAGGNGRVELSVRNRGARRSPVLWARDPFDDGRRWARFHIAPLQPGERVRAAYRLPTADRGIFPLGPLTIGLTDPFGLASQARQSAPAATLVVYPRVDVILPMAQAQGADPTGSSGQPSVRFGGEDFYALREYQTGDDLRRVHWPSSARMDELMIRQDELPWLGRATVLVDVRAGQHSPESFELALSAAASIVTAGSRAGRQVRLVTSDGLDTGFGSGHTQLSMILSRLAGTKPGRGATLSVGLSVLERGGTSGGVAVVTTDAVTDEDRAVLRRLRSRIGSVTVVVFDGVARGSGGAPSSTPLLLGRGRVVLVGEGRPFAAVWNAAVGRSSTRFVAFDPSSARTGPGLASMPAPPREAKTP